MQTHLLFKFNSQFRNQHSCDINYKNLFFKGVRNCMRSSYCKRGKINHCKLLKYYWYIFFKIILLFVLHKRVCISKLKNKTKIWDTLILYTILYTHVSYSCMISFIYVNGKCILIYFSIDWLKCFYYKKCIYILKVWIIRGQVHIYVPSYL